MQQQLNQKPPPTYERTPVSDSEEDEENDEEVDDEEDENGGYTSSNTRNNTKNVVFVKPAKQTDSLVSKAGSLSNNLKQSQNK